MVRASQVVLGLKNLPTDAGQAREEGLIPRSGGFPWRRKLATHSSILAWKVPWTEEPGGLQSMESQKNLIQVSN